MNILPSYTLPRPSGLERLAEEGSEIIIKLEQGKLSQYLEKYKPAKDHIHKYQRFFDYLEEGHDNYITNLRSLKAGETNRIQVDRNKIRLYNKYKSIVMEGLVWFGEDTFKFCTHLKYYPELKTFNEFHYEYFRKIERAWENPAQIKPGNKKTIELMKNFNEVTGYIARYGIDENHKLNFNTERNEWVYEYAPRIIKRY